MATENNVSHRETDEHKETPNPTTNRSNANNTSTSKDDLQLDLQDLDEPDHANSDLNSTYVVETANKKYPANPVHVKTPDTDRDKVQSTEPAQIEREKSDFPPQKPVHVKQRSDIDESTSGYEELEREKSFFPQKPVYVNRLTNNVKCDQCGMLFNSSETLRQHKNQFCVGTEDSGIKNYSPVDLKHHPITSNRSYNGKNDLTSLLNVNSNTNEPINDSIFNRSLGVKSDNPAIDDDEFNLNPYQAQSAINELKSYKNKKSMEQSLRDMEDTLIRDTIRDKKLATSLHHKTPLAMSPLDHNNQNSLNNAHEANATSLDSFNKYIKSSNDDPFKFLLNEVGHFSLVL